jgi:uncharacterized protein involved in outer membrane biogenesis
MKKFLMFIGILVVVVVAIAAVAVATFDVNKYRGQIAETLSKQTGRTVKLNGPIKLALSLQGVKLGIQDAAIGNPSWASRPQMAGIGRFKLGVALMPLLDHRLVVTGLEIENADILLESAEGNRNNWDLGGVKPAVQPEAGTPEVSQSVAVHVDKLSVKNSQIAMRGIDGKTTVFKTGEMTLGDEKGGMVLHFKGEYGGQSITLEVKSNGDDLTSKKVRPIEANLAFANYHVTASGKAALDDKKASLDSYELTADKSSLHGQLALDWSGAKPYAQGTILSDHLAVEDFKMPPGKEQGAANSGAAASGGPERLFSDAPLGLDALKSANADFDVAISEMVLGSVTLAQTTTRLALANDKLTIAPFKAALGSGALEGQIILDAAQTPPHLGMTFTANSVDIGDLMHLGGIEAFLSGKVNADMNIVSSGNSLHQLASNVSGSINVIGAGGDVVNSAADKVSAGLANLFAPGSANGNESMNCIVVRFTAANGIVKDNGILVDTSATTVAGNGGADLRSETIDLLLRAKPKLINTGGLLPPVHVGGTLLHPDFGVSAATVVQNVASEFLGVGPGTVGNAVPNITTQQGQNACLYTLQHPSAASAAPAQGGAVQGLAGKAGDTVNKLGGKLRGLLGQ